MIVVPDTGKRVVNWGTRAGLMELTISGDTDELNSHTNKYLVTQHDQCSERKEQEPMRAYK